MNLSQARGKLMLAGALVAYCLIWFLFLLGFFVGGLWAGIACLVLSGGAAYTFAIRKKRSPTRVAATVLGVLGGVITSFTLVALLFHLLYPPPPVPPPLVPPEAYPFPPEAYQLPPEAYPFVLDARLLFLGVVGATLASLMAIGGGLLALERPRVGGMLMLLPPIVGFFTYLLFDRFFVPGSFLLLPGGALALAPDKKRPDAIYAAMILGIIGGHFAYLCAVAGHAGYFRFLHGKEVLAFWLWVLLFPGMGLLGGILVLLKPKVAGILMLVSGIIGPVGFIAFGFLGEFFYLVIMALASFPLIIAGIIASITKLPAGETSQIDKKATRFSS